MFGEILPQGCRNLSYVLRRLPASNYTVQKEDSTNVFCATYDENIFVSPDGFVETMESFAERFE
jgi:hypothetical protein